MPRQSLERKDYTFVGGLNTEAGPLTFPENAWLDGDNMEPEIDGSINRRSKIDLEANFQRSTSFGTSDKELFAYADFKWTNVAGSGDLTFIVVQQGYTIRFYSTAGASLTPNIKSFTIDLTAYKVASSPNIFGTSPIDCATGSGRLIIVSEDTDPILVEYNPTSDTITVTEITLQMRDFYGVADENEIDVRPATLSAAHNYNLLNQGWDTTKINAYFAADAVYPSNAQIWTSGKDTTDDFDPALLDKQDFGTTAAPRGRYILDIFNRDRTTVSGVLGITADTEIARPRATAFFAGRVWYSGVKSSTIGSWVMFSQITEDISKYGHCYQDADPTAEYISDLVPTDGGIIPIPEAGGISKLLPLQESLIVFADNGIWQILGNTSGFTADGYQVKKISSFGCISPTSVVEVEDTAMYWSTAGIFAIKRDNVSGDFHSLPISAEKIQTLYTSIATAAKKYCVGFYDDETKKVRWLFSTATSESAVDRFKKGRMLVLDLRLQAFYTHTYATGSPILVSGILAVGQGDQNVVFNVIADTDSVLATADTVVATINIPSTGPRISKYLTVLPATSTPGETNWTLTYSDFEATQDSPTKFKDWYSFDSVGVETSTLPYIITGYQILNDGAKTYQTPYITVFMQRTEDGFTASGSDINADNVSSCMMQARWEWTDSTAANRWTTAREVYRHRRAFTPALVTDPYDDGYPVVISKNKIRGKGKALSLKFACSSGKDMQLLGWSTMNAKNTNV